VTGIWLSEFTYRKFTKTVPRPLSMCCNFIFCTGLKELYQRIYRPFSTLLEHTRILVEGLHNSEQHIHVFTETNVISMTIWKQQRKRADISALTFQHKPINMSQPFICNEQELKFDVFLIVHHSIDLFQLPT
jgi:hypothetical protein